MTSFTSRLKAKDISIKTSAKDQSASFGKVPITVLPMPTVKVLVRVEAVKSGFLASKARYR